MGHRGAARGAAMSHTRWQLYPSLLDLDGLLQRLSLANARTPTLPEPTPISLKASP